MSKVDQSWSNWISPWSKNVVSIIKRSSFELNSYKIFLSIYLPFIKKANIFQSDLSKMDQNGSNLIKLEFSPIKKCCYKKLSHLLLWKKLSLYFWSDWIRTVQNGSNLIKLEFSPIKKCWHKKLSHSSWGYKWSKCFDQIGSDLSKMDQNWIPP